MIKKKQRTQDIWFMVENVDVEQFNAEHGHIVKKENNKVYLEVDIGKTVV